MPSYAESAKTQSLWSFSRGALLVQPTLVNRLSMWKRV